MNVIVTNKNQHTLQNLEFDIIKELNGEFEVDSLVAQFQNFFYQRMILDITAIKDYHDIKNLQKLSISLDMDKLILYLGDVPEGDSNEYLSLLISMGIYNFTKNVDGINYLYSNPNTYRDVAHFHQLELSSEKETNDNYDGTPARVSKKIIGIENVTAQSGATTLLYLLKKELSKNYSVVGIEMNKRDFTYLNDKELVSTSDNELNGVINKYKDHDIILIDVNGSNTAEGACNEVIYLVEPSIIKLNKLMVINRNKFEALKNKKVVLNQSLLTSKDVLDFEYESKLKVFFNMPPLNERENDINILNIFLQKMGFERQNTEEVEKKNKLLGIFNI